MYLAGLRARFECLACILVLTPSEAVAEWAHRPIDVLSCVELDVLDRWMRKAVTVASADELFAA